MYPYINLFGLSIPSYGLMMALAFIAAILIAYYRTSKAGLDTDALLTLAIITLTCGLAGSYLLYIFVTYSLSEIWGSIVDGSFSVFKSGENTTSKSQFTKKWIELINRLERNKNVNSRKKS